MKCLNETKFTEIQNLLISRVNKISAKLLNAGLRAVISCPNTSKRLLRKGLRTSCQNSFQAETKCILLVFTGKNHNLDAEMQKISYWYYLKNTRCSRSKVPKKIF